MFKKSVVFACVITFAFSLVLAVGVSLASDKGPSEMVLKTEAAKKPANFPHKKHQEQDGLSCASCHHTKDADGKRVDYTEGMEIKKCVECHNKDLANAKLNSFKLAAHKLCKNCHKEQVKAGKKPPTKCTGCHPKKKK